MTTCEIAKLIDNTQLKSTIDPSVLELCKEYGYLIAYASIDDNLYLRGALNETLMTINGFSHSNTLDGKAAPLEILKLIKAHDIKSETSNENEETFWTVTTSAKSSKFRLFQNDQLACIGIVIAL